MKKVLALLLCLALLATSLVACSSKEEPKADEPAATEAADKPAEVQPEAKEDVPPAEELEPVTLKMYFHGSNVTNDTDVLAKANEYLKEKLNVTLEPIWGTWGNYDENAALAINTGEKIDIYFTASWGTVEYNSFAKKGAFVRLDDPDNNILAKYGQDVWNLLPEVLKQGATVNGSEGYGVYAVPGYKDIATQNCWDINVPLLNKYGYTIDDIKNADYFTFGDILETVKKGEGDDFYPLLVEGMVLERMVTNSIIVTGDAGGFNVLSYYIDPKDPSKPAAEYGTKFYNKFATEAYKKFAEKTREYFLAGYIDPSLGIANQADDTLVAKRLSGDYLIGTQVYSLGYEAQASADRGFEVQYVPCTPAYVDTTSSQGAMMAISVASEHPDRAMMFLNLLNTDPYLFTLLDFGIEGVHYNMVDGEAVFTDKRNDYMPWTNGMGNVTQLPPLQGQGVDFWDTFKSYYGGASETEILGFALDPTPVENELLALANVGSEYGLGLNTGTIDPAVKLPEFLEKMTQNGIDKVVDEANAQLQEFLAAKGK